MTVFPLHRKPPTRPVNTSGDYCRMCWTPAGREHGLACTAAPRPRLAYPQAARVFAGLLTARPLGIAGWLIAAALLLLIGAAA